MASKSKANVTICNQIQKVDKTEMAAKSKANVTICNQIQKVDKIDMAAKLWGNATKSKWNIDKIQIYGFH